MDTIHRILLLLSPFHLYHHHPRTFYIIRSMLPALLIAIYFIAAPNFIGVNAHPLHWIRKLALPRTPGGTTGSEDGSAAWFWGWAWATDGSVSIVDRTPAITFPARPASFGLELVDPLLGYVLPLSSFTAPCPNVSNSTSTSSRWRFDADPVLGCPDLCISGPHQPDQTEKWIALVQRGGCPFVEKARQAQRLGAKAVVVGGDRENPDALLNMYSERDSSDIAIAATYIKYWDYLQLSDLIASSNTSHNGLRTLSLLITTEYSAWEWYSPIITFIVILLLPTILTFITLLIHRIRAARAAQRDRAPQEFVHRLPWRVWTGTGWEKHDAVFTEDPSEDPSSAPPASANFNSEGDMERGEGQPRRPSGGDDEEDEPEWVEQQEECAICLEDFVKGDRVRVLPCQHMFHMNEVDEWLIHKKKTCPVCKADVTQPRPPWAQPHHHPETPPPPHPTEEPQPPSLQLSPSVSPPMQRTSSAAVTCTSPPSSSSSTPASASTSRSTSPSSSSSTTTPTELTPLIQRPS